MGLVALASERFSLLKVSSRGVLAVVGGGVCVWLALLFWEHY